MKIKDTDSICPPCSCCDPAWQERQRIIHVGRVKRVHSTSMSSAGEDWQSSCSWDEERGEGNRRERGNWADFHRRWQKHWKFLKMSIFSNFVTKVSNKKKHCRHTWSQHCGSHTKSTPSFWTKSSWISPLFARSLVADSGILTYFERYCNTEIILIQAAPQQSASDDLYLNMHFSFAISPFSVFLLPTTMHNLVL